MRFLLIAIGLLAACVDTPRPPGGDAGGDCQAINQDVTIQSPADASGLPKTGCWDLYGKLTIKGSSITTLSILGDIRSANDIEIDNTGLTSFDTKSPVDLWYGAIIVNSNPQLTSFKNITIHDGHMAAFQFDQNAQLASFELSGLTKVDADIAVTNNARLTAVDLSAVTSIGGAVAIDYNNALKTVNLGAPTVLTSFDVTSNPALTSIAGAPSQQVTGNFTIRGNTHLATISGLGQLNLIRGALTIDNNAALTSLSAFPTTSLNIEGVMMITNNPLLTDLGGLSHAFYIYSINITGNSQLPYCTANEVPQCVSEMNNWNVTNNKNSTTNCSFWCR